MPLLRHVRTLFLGNNYSPENTLSVDSFGRCSLDWSPYQNQQADSALALPSPRLGKMQVDWSFLHRWKPLVMAVVNLFTNRYKYAKIAEEAAHSCLLGLSRSVVTAEPKLFLKPLSDTAIVSYAQVSQSAEVPGGPEPIWEVGLRRTVESLESLNFRPRPRYLVSAGDADVLPALCTRVTAPQAVSPRSAITASRQRS